MGRVAIPWDTMQFLVGDGEPPVARLELLPQDAGTPTYVLGDLDLEDLEWLASQARGAAQTLRWRLAEWVDASPSSSAQRIHLVRKNAYTPEQDKRSPRALCGQEVGQYWMLHPLTAPPDDYRRCRRCLQLYRSAITKKGARHVH